MFERKITVKRVNEIAEELRNELAVEINKTIEKRHNTDDLDKIDDLYIYQHALEHSMMNISTLAHRISVNAR